MPGMKKMKRPDRLHWRFWYSLQSSGSHKPPFSWRSVVLRPPKMRIARDPALVDLLSLGMFSGLLGEHLDACPNLAARGDAHGSLPEQRGKCRVRSVDRYHRVGHFETPKRLRESSHH